MYKKASAVQFWMPSHSQFTFLCKSFQMFQPFYSACPHSLKTLVFLSDINCLCLIPHTFLSGLYILDKAGTELVFLTPSHLWHMTFNNPTVVHPIKCAANHDTTSKHAAEILNMYFVGYEQGRVTGSQIDLIEILLYNHYSTSMDILSGLLNKKYLDVLCRIGISCLPR